MIMLFPLKYHDSLHFSRLIKYLAMNDYIRFFRDKPVLGLLSLLLEKFKRMAFITYLLHHLLRRYQFFALSEQFCQIDFEGSRANESL